MLSLNNDTATRKVVSLVKKYQTIRRLEDIVSAEQLPEPLVVDLEELSGLKSPLSEIIIRIQRELNAGQENLFLTDCELEIIVRLEFLLDELDSKTITATSVA
jgi:hypothetical protein